MSWQGPMVDMLRIVIGDNTYSGTYVYTDSRLIQALAFAGYQVCSEMSFDSNYTIDITCSDISPDPYDNDDKAFVNLTVLKAACIMDIGVFRQKAVLSGLVAKCGPATMQTDKHVDGFSTLLDKGPCAMYDALKQELQFGDSHYNNIIHFILSPFVGNDFDPQHVLDNFGNTDRIIR